MSVCYLDFLGGFVLAGLIFALIVYLFSLKKEPVERYHYDHM